MQEIVKEKKGITTKEEVKSVEKNKIAILKQNIMKNIRIKQSIKNIRRNWQLYVLLIIPLLYIMIFHYYPMYGAQIAFKNYKVSQGVWGSEWVGFKNFIRFFESYQFWQVIKNTLTLSLYSLLAGAPFPILLAIMLKYLPGKKFKKIVQTVSYAPHFISTVVMVSIIIDVLDPRTGMLNNILAMFGINFTANLMGSAAAFPSLYVWSGIWQNIGFSAIIYTAILAGVDPTLHEAATVDGASILQRIRHIDFPSLIPQFTLMLILNLGNVLNVGFEKVLLMSNNMNSSAAEVIDTFVYKMGIAASLPDVSYTTAIGLFKSFIALILIIVVNQIAKKVGETSLW